MSQKPINVPRRLTELVLLQFTKLDSSNCYMPEIQRLPDNLIIDYYFTMLESDQLHCLRFELSDVHLFHRLVKSRLKRAKLYRIVTRIIGDECHEFKQLFCSFDDFNDTSPNQLLKIEMGFRIGCFFSEVGLFSISEKFFNEVLYLCEQFKNYSFALECYIQLLRVQLIFGLFIEARQLFNKTERLLEELKYNFYNMAAVYTIFSEYYCAFGNYNKGIEYANKSLKALNNESGKITLINAVKQAAKAYAEKKLLEQSEVLIHYAVHVSSLYLEEWHPKFAEVLIDYGFCLANANLYDKCYELYQLALRIQESLFGKANFLTGLTYMNLSYCLYVREYRLSIFDLSREYANRAVDTLSKFAKKKSYVIVLAKRIEALILEELALNAQIYGSIYGLSTSLSMLEQAEKVHLSTLYLAIDYFGEESVHTAKHYGNLGRLYQSMQKYKASERMHLKAISIKERLLGPDDFEVAMSVGHLAALYNYNLERHDWAVDLYQRSIRIYTNLFGEACSALRYDYQGLIDAYDKLNNIPAMHYYQLKLSEWVDSSKSVDSADLFPETALAFDTILREWLHV